MKKIYCACLAVLIFISCLSFIGSAEGSIQPNGLPDIFPRTATVGDSKAAPAKCFNSYGSENGLEGLKCYLVGKVVQYEEQPMEEGKILHCFIIQTEYGYAFNMDMYSYVMEYKATTPELKAEVEEPGADYSFPEIGSFVKVVCMYSGYSDVYKMPVFYYGAPVAFLSHDSNEVSNNQSQQSYTPTTGESNALRKAYDYLNIMAFSRNGLIRQLEHDGFTTAEATYAVDNCYEDWFKQAASKAEQYLSIMGFSKERLIQQLEHDGFTHEEAVYGAEQNGY